MDEKDFETAAALEQLARDVAISQARRQVGSDPPEGFDGSCPECGVEIPPKRVAAGYFTCVDCVEERELRKRLGL